MATTLTDTRHYAEVHPSQVPAATLEAANSTLRYVRRDLHLPDLRIRWFVEQDKAMAQAVRHQRQQWGTPVLSTVTTFEQDVRIAGLARRREADEIWVSASLSPDEARRTVAHEGRHRWQWKVWPLRAVTDTAVCEQDATDYEQRMGG